MNEINFNKAKLCFENGVNYFKNNQYKQAENEFLNSLEFLPDRLSVISNLIQIYINTENKAGLSNLLFKYKHLKKEKGHARCPFQFAVTRQITPLRNQLYDG